MWRLSYLFVHHPHWRLREIMPLLAICCTLLPKIPVFLLSTVWSSCYGPQSAVSVGTHSCEKKLAFRPVRYSDSSMTCTGGQHCSAQKCLLTGSAHKMKFRHDWLYERNGVTPCLCCAVWRRVLVAPVPAMLCHAVSLSIADSTVLQTELPRNRHTYVTTHRNVPLRAVS